jgi:hypothetical protein
MAHMPTILEIRLLVGFLGERAQYCWWPTAFYETSSRLFLEPIFSKTSVLAQYHGVLEAARQLHDEHLSVGSYHLFRLPEEVEQDLHAMLQTSAGEELANKSTQNKEASLDSLKRLAGTNMPAKPGPTAVGNIKIFESADISKAIAGIYLSAFSAGLRSYPYLVSQA